MENELKLLKGMFGSQKSVQLFVNQLFKQAWHEKNPNAIEATEPLSLSVIRKPFYLRPDPLSVFPNDVAWRFYSIENWFHRQTALNDCSKDFLASYHSFIAACVRKWIWFALGFLGSNYPIFGLRSNWFPEYATVQRRVAWEILNAFVFWLPEFARLKTRFRYATTPESLGGTPVWTIRFVEIFSACDTILDVTELARNYNNDLVRYLQSRDLIILKSSRAFLTGRDTSS